MSTPALRIATYNIRKCVGTDWRRDPARVLAVIDRLGADIVALQEVDTRLGARPAALTGVEAAGWHSVPVRQGPQSLGWHGNAILLSPRIRVTTCAPLDLPGLEPRGAVLAEVAGPEFALRLISVHLGLRRRDRRRQVQAIARGLRARPAMETVILGDFNEWRTDARAGIGLDGFAVHSPGHSFHASRPVARLDRILTSGGLDVLRAGVHRCALSARASDHLPVWADIAPVTALAEEDRPHRVR